jgi:hypothetical protein
MNWIPALKDSRPEKDQIVLALLENGEMHVLKFDGEWVYDHLYPLDPDFCQYHEFYRVRYWAPLPEPPKENNGMD